MNSQQSDTKPSEPTPTRGVWGFVKRKVWGDAPSQPISNSGSKRQRAASPQEVDHPPAHADRSTLQAGTSPVDSSPHSPFQSHKVTSIEDESDEDQLQDQATGDSAVSHTVSAMASEPSLRHGLGEGMRCLVYSRVPYPLARSCYGCYLPSAHTDL